MELRQLRYFLAVADELHFGRAAQKLHMSQPPLSVQVGRLEREAGVALFERTTRRVTLTPAGRHLQERARRIIDEVDDVRAEMRAYVDGLAGQLTAGFVSSANYTVLPEVAQLFRARRPNVALSLVPLTSGEQFARLREGSLDVGIVRDEDPRGDSSSPRLSTQVVFEERLVACLPIGHPLAGRTEVTPEEIIEVPMIAYPRSLMPGYVDRVTATLGAAGTMRVVEEVVHQETALGFVAAGLGTSILPESVRMLVPPSIAIVPLAGSPTTRLLAAHQVRDDVSAVVAAFIACLHDAADALSTRRDVSA
ncbi:LysR family transcriptional regulator [Microbacterium oxydans]|uniref:LysR family transcriptional regulator n=1 Tax=Microbacterium oxydans TaxID=82380 RepID=UPI00226B9438|nr:LysR substrate-binding domain-containing protein [Microbacterium oxydans]WAA65046.1 LysR substrate-binding domain-containing protein [Microbacterium oxydans]